MLPYLHQNNGTKRFWQFRHGIGVSQGCSLALRSRQQLLQLSKRQESHAACQPDRPSALQTAADSSCSPLQEHAAS